MELASMSKHRSKEKHIESSRNNYNCPYMKLAREFRSTLNWKRSLFDTSHDKCYCANCYLPQWPDIVRAGGADYVIPRGWVRLGLHVDTALADNHNIWKDWVITFHGTTTMAAHSILLHRQFVLPGDKLIDGTPLGICPGHIPGKNHIYTSPTIAYSSLPVYSPVQEFCSQSTNDDFEVQIVFQCRQKPTTFKVQGETISAGTKRICAFIPNDKIEYFTEARSSVVAYGLLVRVQ